MERRVPERTGWRKPRKAEYNQNIQHACEIGI